MESVFIYLIKSSGIIAVFYLAYHFLVRKETFFNSNRWFLLSGLVTSLLLPLFFIKKIILVEKPKPSMEDLVAYSQHASKTIQDVPIIEAFDWMQLIWVSYIIIACALLIKIVFNFTSLYRMLYQQQIIRKEQFKLVNLNENIAPFSFFNYIIYNSDLYTNDELQSILLHEKIHSQEKHSVDILVAKLFSIVFWFNPFVWLYKKAITQNLEYIADQKAIEQLEDKKSYQRALLKVVSHQSCLSLTNNFYQSLIKKRIVMLNKNQSHARNSWKYALIIPALIGFVLLFQIETIAQEKEASKFTKRVSHGDDIRVVVDKNSSEDELKKEAKRLKAEHGITLKYSKVKRNSAGEITGIKVEYKDKDGNKGVSQLDGKEPIKPIHFYKNNQSIGFGSPKQVKVYASNNRNEDKVIELAIDDSTKVADNFDFNFDVDVDAPEFPEAPESPEVAVAPSFPKHIWNDADTETTIIVKKEGAKPLVILNGKVIEGDESVISKKELDELIDSSRKDANVKHININWNDAVKIRNEAMANENIQMKRIRPLMKKEIERTKADMERAKLEMEFSKPDMAKAKAEMLQAKEEMDAAKAELEKARAELKNQKK